MKLLLFDIDGTLIRAHGAGRTAIEKALSTVCGSSISTDGVRFSGKTDPQIIGEILRANGLTDSTSFLDDALAAYEEVACAALSADDIELLPGVADLLNQLNARSDVQLGLLTGNIEPMAYRKLGAVELDRHFPFGAFGSDHADRYQLPDVALRRARRHTGHAFGGSDMVIIGDTEHDICCGRKIGARAVGVCTGRYARAELAPHEPDVLLDDLSAPDQFLQAVLNEHGTR